MTELGDRMPCETLPPLPQSEVKRGIEEDRRRAAAAEDDEPAVDSE